LTSYRADLVRLGIRPGVPAHLALARVINSLCEAATLPMPGDYEGPPSQPVADRYEQAEGRRLLSVYARRARGHRLWVWYVARGRQGRVDILAVTTTVPS
jgi:hypothetical protein